MERGAKVSEGAGSGSSRPWHERLHLQAASPWAVAAFGLGLPYLLTGDAGTSQLVSGIALACVGFAGTYALARLIGREPTSAERLGADAIRSRCEEAEEALLDSLSDSAGLIGWPHFLGPRHHGVTVLATAYGLLTLQLLGSNDRRFDEESLVRTLVALKGDKPGWGSSSQGSVASPEATATVLLAVWPHREVARAQITDALDWLLGIARGAARDDLFGRTLVATTVLEALALLAPGDEAIGQLVDLLIDGRVRPGDGRSAWSEVLPGRQTTGSIAHTGRAVVALGAARERQRRVPGAITEAQRWLTEQVQHKPGALATSIEELIRPVPEALQAPGSRPYTSMTHRHLPAPWVILALDGLTTGPAVAARGLAESDLMNHFDTGLWRWPEPEADFPVWMTYQAVRALRSLA